MVVALITGAAVALTAASTAWACTLVIAEACKTCHDLIHSPGIPAHPDVDSVATQVTAVGVDVPGHLTGTYDVYQDDDGTAGTGSSTPTACTAQDPKIGTVTYDDTNNGTGTATVQKFKGPGVYETCAGPDPRYTKGYFTFL